MQILMSQAAYERVQSRLAPFGDAIEVVAMGADGGFMRNGAPLAAEAVDPQIYWISLDLYPGRSPQGGLAAFIGKVAQGTRGQWVQVFSAGIDHPMFKALMQKGLRLSKSQAQAPPIAEYVLSHAFSLLHPVVEQARAQAESVWKRIAFREIAAIRWALVGFGSIGVEIARRLRPFGAHLTVVRRAQTQDALFDEVRAQADLPQVLPQADVVVLACPLNDETRGMADARFFASMKPGAILINIGRGDLVDEAALKAGLERDQPAHAVLDVFHTEPLPAGSWFWGHPKVRVTAHASNAGTGVLARSDTQFLENLRRFLAGEPLIAEAQPYEAGL